MQWRLSEGESGRSTGGNGDGEVGACDFVWPGNDCYFGFADARRPPTLTFAESPLTRDLIEPVGHGTVPSHCQPRTQPQKNTPSQARAKNLEKSQHRGLVRKNEHYKHKQIHEHTDEAWGESRCVLVTRIARHGNLTARLPSQPS